MTLVSGARLCEHISHNSTAKTNMNKTVETRFLTCLSFSEVDCTKCPKSPAQLLVRKGNLHRAPHHYRPLFCMAVCSQHQLNEMVSC